MRNLTKTSPTVAFSINSNSWSHRWCKHLTAPRHYSSIKNERSVTLCKAHPFSASYGGQPSIARDAMPDIPQAPSTSGRKIVFAVDGTTEAEEALRWVASQLARKGDTIHMVHVMVDPRTPSTAVGSSTAATQWSPARDEQAFSKEYFLRMEHEAHTMLANRFIPSVQFTGIDYEVDLLGLRVHKSAAGIGEAICNKAVDIGADVVVIASHGAGVLAEFGSVARWCMDNSKVPVLLVPPPILRNNATPATNTIIVAATDNLPGLKTSFDFALDQVARTGDSLYVLHVQQPMDEDAAVNARKQLIANVLKWQAESPKPIAPTLNIAVDIVAVSTNSESPDSNNPAGDALCAYAADLNARTVVLHHHGKSMMREFVYGPVTIEVTKYCSRPLVVLGAQDGDDGPVTSLSSM